MVSVRKAKWIAAGGAVACATLVWPYPASATSTLGGYTASVDASVVHVEMYEPVIPVPSEPQGDFSVGYAQASAQSGTTRALASYLWPGSVVGDGFDQITQQPGSRYPVQVNSRYPATSQAPKSNRAQLTRGNGMSTYADPDQARATTSGLGIHAPDTNPASGAGQGVGQIVSSLPLPGGSAPSSSAPSSSSAPPSNPVPTAGPSGLPKPPKSPVPVPAPLAALVTVHGLTSSANIDARGARVVSAATAYASEVDLLGGIVKLTGVDVVSRIVSNGKHAVDVGAVHLAGLDLAGKPIELGKHGLSVPGKKAPAPQVPAQVRAGLKQLGISFSIAPVLRTVQGPSGTFAAQGLTVTVDTAVLRSKLDGPVNTIANLLPPDVRTQLEPLFALRPKLVFKIGETRNSATSAPPYVFPPLGNPTGSGGGSHPNPVTGGGGGSTGGLGGLTGGGSTTSGGMTTGTSTTGTAGAPTTGGAPTSGTAPAPQQAALSLPALGTMPRLFVLGALVLAAGIGWALQTAGGALFGGASPCQYGLRKGVPNLRKP